MPNKTKSVVFFDKETKCKIKDTTYIVISHFNDNSECLPDKIKRLLKSETQKQ